MPFASRKRKIFVGMLPDDTAVDDVQQMFEPFGAILKCKVFRPAEQAKRCCAFVTFSCTDHAAAAVQGMNRRPIAKRNGSGTRSLIVNFSETDEEKVLRREFMLRTKLRDFRATAAWEAACSYDEDPQPVVDHRNLPSTNYSAAQQLNLAPHHVLHYTTFIGYPQNPSTPPASLANYLTAGNFLNPSTLANSSVAMKPFVNPCIVQNLVPLTTIKTSNPVTPMGYIPQSLLVGPPLHYSPRNNNNKNKYPKGPDGANLYIYNLPYTFTKAELLSLFEPFGKVLSALIYIDKNTITSKGFGFVSFDSALTAQKAMQTLNSTKIGNKMLVVELKRDE